MPACSAWIVTARAAGTWIIATSARQTLSGRSDLAATAADGREDMARLPARSSSDCVAGRRTGYRRELPPHAPPVPEPRQLWVIWCPCGAAVSADAADAPSLRRA